MKKKGILLLCFIVTAVILVRYTEIGYEVYSRLWFGPKMKCIITVSADGQPVSLSKKNVTGMMMNDRKENTISFFRSRKNGCRFRCKGGVYGKQPFMLAFQTDTMSEEMVIPVDVIISDCWRTTDIMLDICADTKSGTYTFSATLNEGRESISCEGERSSADGEAIRISDI